ncbi:MAG: hypothetical protein M3376_09285, partial [Actinomycetota bacterium]|nr:hypothetical protein [Actinomycetota bacterium]
MALFAGGLLLVGLAVRAVPGLGEVRTRLTDADAAGIALIALLELGSIVGFVAALRGAFSSIPPWRVATALGTAEQAANVLLPAGGVGGLALGAVVARDAGVPADIAVTRTVALFLVTSGVTFAGIVAGGVLAALSGVPWYGSIVPAMLAALVFATVASLPRILRAGGERRRHRISTSTRAGVVAARRLVRDPNPTLLAGAVGYFALDVGALAAAFHAVGAET